MLKITATGGESTGPDENGMAVGIAANPEHSAEESLSSALQFARQHLTAAIEPAAA